MRGLLPLLHPVAGSSATPTQNFNRKEHEAQLDYIRRTPQIRDVLISGGDGLTLAPKLLESALRGLREIPHVEVIRIGSRVPVFLPQRIDDELCEMLAKYHPLWLNIHVNHPNEITPELSRACDKLARAGIPLGNQSVLLAGVNDCVHTQRELVQRLVENRVRPYYLYQCDLVEGAGHFRTPVGKGLEIIEGLRGHTSGYAVPQFIVDAPGGGGKIPVMPNYLVVYSDHKVILRNYEGYITTYEEPADYPPHDRRAASTARTRARSRARRASPGCSTARRCGSSPPASTGPRARQHRGAPAQRPVQVGAVRRWRDRGTVHGRRARPAGAQARGRLDGVGSADDGDAEEEEAAAGPVDRRCAVRLRAAGLAKSAATPGAGAPCASRRPGSLGGRRADDARHPGACRAGGR